MNYKSSQRNLPKIATIVYMLTIPGLLGLIVLGNTPEEVIALALQVALALISLMKEEGFFANQG